MSNSYILLLFILALSHTSIISSRYLNNSESGRILIDNVQNTSRYGFDTMTFKVHYVNPFINIPHLLLGIHSWNNCPANNQQLAQLYSNLRTNTTTDLIFAGIYNYLHHNDLNYAFVLNYFVVDVKIVTNMAIVSKYYQSTSSDLTTSQTFYNPHLKSINYFQCWITSIYPMRALTSPFKLDTKCTIVDPTTIRFQFSTTAVIGGSESFYMMRYFGLIVFDDYLLELKVGYLDVDVNLVYPTADVDRYAVGSEYFIGLKSFEVNNACLKLRLNDDAVVVTTNSQFLTVKYSYFQLLFPKKLDVVLRIESVVYESQFVFRFAFDNPVNLSLISTQKIIDTPLSYRSYLSHTLTTNIVSPIADDLINVKLNFSESIGKFQVATVFKLITIHRMTVNVFQNEVDLVLTNIFEDSNNQLNILFDDSNVNIKSVNNAINQTHVKLGINKNVRGKQLRLTYTNNINIIDILFDIPTVTQIITSALSTASSFLIEGIPNIANKYNRIQWESNNINSPVLKDDNSDSVIEAYFNYLPSIQITDISLSYIPNINPSLDLFKLYLNLKLITIMSVSMDLNSTISIITLINCKSIISQSLTDFTFSNPTVTAKSIQTVGNQVQIQVQYDSNYDNSYFNVTLAPSQGDYSIEAVVQNVRLKPMLLKAEIDIFQHYFNLTFNHTNLGNSNPIITFNNPIFQLNPPQIINNLLVVSSKYNQTIHQLGKLQVFYDTDPSTLYYHTFTMEIGNNFLYCISHFPHNSAGFKITSIIIVVAYWMVFIIAVFLNQKIYAVEMMFVLQFGFMSLIPIGTYCPPFSSLSYLKYSFGWNDIGMNIQQKSLSLYYSSLDIKSNFLTNFNLMFVPFLIFVILAVLFSLIKKRVQNYQTKQYLEKYSKALIFDIPFAFLLVNIPNICVSSVIGVQTFGIFDNMSSLVPSIIMVLFIFVGIILFLVFRNSFKEFKRQFFSKNKLCGLSITKSVFIRSFYPLLLILQMILVSTLLALESFFQISIYVSLVVFSFMGIIIIALCPYSNAVNNIRLVLHRLMLIGICGGQIAFKIFRDDYAVESSTVYQYPWVLLFLLILNLLGVNLPFMIYNINSQFKSKSQHFAKNNQTNKRERPLYPFEPFSNSGPSMMYPALEYSIFRVQKSKVLKAQKEHIERKQLLMIPRINQSPMNARVEWQNPSPEGKNQ